MYFARGFIQGVQARRQPGEAGRLRCGRVFSGSGGHVQAHEGFQAQAGQRLLLQAGMPDDGGGKNAPGLARWVLPEQHRP